MTSRNPNPVIGITMDVVETSGRLKYDCSAAYATCVAKAGGTPVMLPPIAAMIPRHLALCDGFILTGGDDPKMEPFGVPTHPQAKVIHPDRQAYELGLLESLRSKEPQKPLLGVCLGMQLMCLHAGGRLNQFLPDTLPTHAMHKNAEHRVSPQNSPIGNQFLPNDGTVWSNHRQAIDDAGSLVVIGLSEDRVIEAVCDPARRWCLGVQWHPERTANLSMGQQILNDLVSASSMRP